MSQEQPPIRSRRELRKARDAQPASAPEVAEQVSPAANRTSSTPPSVQRVAATPSPANPAAADAADHEPEQTHAQRSSQIRARDRAALRTIKELEEKEGQLSSGSGPTRRQLRLQQLKEQTLTAATPVVAPAVSDTPLVPSADSPPAPTQPAENHPSPVAPAPEGMTVEQALAARSLIAEQAKNQIAKMEHIASLDPEAVDPAILAEQIALAERAAIMNRRAMAKQKLADQATAPAPPKEPGTERSGPSTVSNLAMVTPLEFVEVPGVDRPVMKPPATSHVPVSTRPGTKVPGPGTQKRRPPSRPKADTAEGGEGRSHVIARAEAAARAATRPKSVVFPENQSEDLFEELPRIPASSAYGLEPLDAATAGLARAQRSRILQFCILIFGILALASGILLIISGISR